MTALAIAHRAGNSLSALASALEAGAHVAEADVHAHRGRLEVRHAKSLGPLPWYWDRHGRGSLPSLRDEWQLLPSSGQLELDALLDAAGHGVVLMLDLKGAGRVGEAVAAALHRRAPRSPVVVCGRWWPSVEAFGRYDWARQVLSARGRAELQRLRHRVRSGRAPYGVSLHRSLLTPAVVEELRSRVEVVMTWPVDDAAALEQVLAVGVNGVISDDLDVVRALAASGPAPVTWTR